MRKVMIAAILGFLIMLMAGFVAVRYGRQSQVACTMDAKVCPDGSYVGRSGPNCEFSPCPQ